MITPESKIRPHTQEELDKVEYTTHPFFLEMAEKEKERIMFITTKQKDKIYSKLQCSSCSVLPKLDKAFADKCLREGWNAC